MFRTHGYDKYERTLPMCCYRMEPTAITRWSKTVGAGGIGSMRQEIGAGRVGEGSGEAREARKGLWAESLPVPPWEWRKIKR
jgi:endonuclease YncB( thermonuclease family)